MEKEKKVTWVDLVKNKLLEEIARSGEEGASEISLLPYIKDIGNQYGFDLGLNDVASIISELKQENKISSLGTSIWRQKKM
jgi:hypothetical protein